MDSLEDLRYIEIMNERAISSEVALFLMEKNKGRCGILPTKKKKADKPLPANQQKGSKICSCCGQNKKLTEYYLSYNPMYSVDQRVPICKSCCKERSLNSDGTINYPQFKEVLKNIGKPLFYDSLWSSFETVKRENSYLSEEEVELHGEDIIARYFRNVAMRQDRAISFSDSEKDGFMHQNNNRTVEEKTKILNKYLPLFEVDVVKPNIPTTTATQTIIQTIQTPQPEPLIYNEFWMGDYTERDINILDKYYAGLNRDYKIVTENHRDYAKKIAKASLMMDKAYEDMLRGVSGADKMYASAKDIFDSLSKSAKFSEDKRSINDVGISSFSKITSLVENHNWIPQHVPKEKDMFDEMLEALSVINQSI